MLARYDMGTEVLTAKINGPITYPKTKMLTVKALSIREELWNSSSINDTPGFDDDQ